MKYKKGDVGKLVILDDKVYRLIAYCEEPSIDLEDINTKERLCCGVDSILARRLIRLVEEKNE